MAFLFGEDDVKVENENTIITISDSTKDDRQKILIHNISEDEDEVLSPPTTKLKNFTKNGDEASGMEMDDESCICVVFISFLVRAPFGLFTCD